MQYKEHIVPVCLPKYRENFDGRLGTVVGWGRTKYKYGENLLRNSNHYMLTYSIENII